MNDTTRASQWEALQQSLEAARHTGERVVHTLAESAPTGLLRVCDALCNDQDAAAFAQCVSSVESVRGLDCGAGQWSLRMAQTIGTLVASTPRIRLLDLSRCGMSVEAWSELFRALSTRAEVMDVLRVRDAQAAHSLETVWQTASTRPLRLHVVDFVQLGVGTDRLSRVLLHALHPEFVEKLVFANNALDAKSAGIFADVLPAYRRLHTLDLGARVTHGKVIFSNHLRDKGVLQLVPLLREHASLETVVLVNNGVTATGARALLPVYENSTTLRAVTVGVRLQGDEAIRWQSAHVRHNARPTHAADRESCWTAVLPREPRSAELSSTEKASESLDEITRSLQRLSTYANSELEAMPGIRELVTAAYRLSRRAGAKLRVSYAAREEKAQQAVQTAGVRTARNTHVLPNAAVDPVRLVRPKRCYSCQLHYDEIDVFYDRLCPSCAALHHARREQTADLTGRVALVTGARVRIGYHVALKLLRAGATVIAITRFPADALQRYASELDFAVWRERLHLVGLDLSRLADVVDFAQRVEQQWKRLDVLINNAAQTIARPRAYYAHAVALELCAGEVLPSSLREQVGSFRSSAALWKEDESGAIVPFNEYFPAGTNDGTGHPLDLRPMNSWRLRLGEVSPWELVETHAVNVLAPFLLVDRLRSLMAHHNPDARFVVNVTAVEGQFHRAYKSPFHPHTSMAKASLNMLTRACAEDLSTQRIYMNSVDTGWISDQNPAPVSERLKETGFAPPLDEVDAAARVLDPVFATLLGAPAVWGKLLKDYRSVDW